MIASLLGRSYRKRQQALAELLAAHPDLICTLSAETPACLAEEQVIQWQEFGTCAPWGDWLDVTGRKLFQYIDGQPPTPSTPPLSLAKLGYVRRIADWNCDLQDITGLAACKRNLKQISNMDELGMLYLNDLQVDPAEVSREDLMDKYLGYREVRLFRPGSTGESLNKYAWSDRLYLANMGGAHHLAAGRLIASRQGIQVPVAAPLNTHELFVPSVLGEVSKYQMFAVQASRQSPGMFALQGWFRQAKATYILTGMPAPLSETHVCLLLPRNNRRSVEAGEQLAQAGFFELGHLLLELAQLKPDAPGLPTTPINTATSSTSLLGKTSSWLN